MGFFSHRYCILDKKRYLRRTYSGGERARRRKARGQNGTGEKAII